MRSSAAMASPRYRSIGPRQLRSLPQLQRLGAGQRLTLEALAAVLPFKVNSYVTDELIDWDRVPDDPIYQLTFPQPGMLAPDELARIRRLVAQGADPDRLRSEARRIQLRMNPHPAGQMELNVPTVDGVRLRGSQHKYRETLLFFPSQGQTCHAYCTYCFRWAQFVGLEGLKFASNEVDTLSRYLRDHREITDVLFTGGDPMVMSARILGRYLEALLEPELEHVRNIRIGTKVLAYWPYRFLTDPDADELLRLFERVVAAGRHLALMAHFSHPRELETEAVRAAVRRVLATGAVIRCQAPLIRHVNDDARTWATMWRRQVALGMVPYYMFVERDTGPKRYFEVPLDRAYRIFSEAYATVSGLARTVRGPSMSATPGKVLVDGIAEVSGEKVFVLKMLQGRDPSWVNRIFFARWDPDAAWLDELEPALGEREFFFQPYLRRMRQGTWRPSWAVEAETEEEALVG